MRKKWGIDDNEKNESRLAAFYRGTVFVYGLWQQGNTRGNIREPSGCHNSAGGRRDAIKGFVRDTVTATIRGFAGNTATVGDFIRNTATIRGFAENIATDSD